MIVQIYSLTHPDDVRGLVERGVDHIGVAPAGQGVPAEIEADEARALFALLPPNVLGSALTILSDVDAIASMVEEVRPDILHICGEDDEISPQAQQHLRAHLPEGTRIMKAISVGGPETAEQALDAAERFAPVSDFLLLDTAFPDLPGVGATGNVHDWSISARIVERVGADTPVILAGGLGPDNVAEAVRRVKPAGVDSFTLTNKAGQGRRKDLDLIERFVTESRRSAAEIGL